MNELIFIKQLPIIVEKLKEISEEIDIKVTNALSLICNEETLKTVKTIRAELNKENTLNEDKRKEIKNAILQPYEEFEKSYNFYVKDKFKKADTELKTKIDDVENALKAEKENEVREFFNEYLQSKNIDFITYERANINVTLTASLKSLKEQCKSFLDRISDDLALIETQEHKTEILVEYKINLNVSNAITTVSNRHKAIAEEKAKQVDFEEVKEVEQKAVNKVDEVLSAPETEEPEYTLTFKVTATKDKLLKLKEYMNREGMKYE